ncbi:MAG TPA: O-antigen ligase family protein [Gaiellaceae bacterium]|nr:O-antigen ligase family protein [Gaiellaceae bacterium]
MAAIRQMVLWRQLRVPAAAILLVAIAFSLVRARDQPDVAVSVGNTSAHVVPGDIALFLVFVVVLVTLVCRGGLPRAMRVAFAGGVAFLVLVLATAAANGAGALVAAGKMAELAVLAAGAALLARAEDVLEAIVDVLLLFTLVADAIGLVKFVTGGGGRQSAFLGEHDFAALAALPLLYGYVLAFAGRRPRRAALAIVAGAVGCTLGAALASLLGLYLGAAALVLLAALRGFLRLRPLVVVAVTLAAVTGGTVAIRGGELSFLQSWFGKPPSRPGQYAASWSQRLIYTYVDGRVFLDHPVLGTGWYPDLPPREFDRYLSAAHRRFSDQPANYFPPPDRPLNPQQTFDQIPAELGVVGSAAFLVLLAGAVRVAARAPLGAAWLGAGIGAIAGEALYGGTPLTATFWLAVGVALAAGTWGAAPLVAAARGVSLPSSSSDRSLTGV